MKKLVWLVVFAAGGLAYYRYVYAPQKRQEAAAETAYVLPETLPVLDTTAVIRSVLLTYHSGQPVRVLARIGEWAKLALPGGQTGWVQQKDLMDQATFAKAQALLGNLARAQAQAAGHTDESVNARIAPSRDSLKLWELNDNQRVEIYLRRLTPRAPNSSRSDAWYLVRAGGRAGWILGRFVDLDIPPGLAAYAQGINMVAWLKLDSVNDGGREVPQYLAADRIRARQFDFNHIRVFTWWVKRHKYVTAYVESGVDGYFPLTVSGGSVPHFRLRLVDESGNKYQKVYGLFDTIVRPLGTVDGWTSDAMPVPAPRRARRRRRQ